MPLTMDLFHKRPPDYWLFLAVLALLAIGVVMVYSASAIVAYDQYGDSAFFFKRQLIWAGLGIASLMVIQRVHYERLRRLTPVLLAVCVLALIVVLVPGIGRVAGGARRWIAFGSQFGVQPVEPAKLALVLYLANFLTNRGPAVDDLRSGLLPPLLMMGTMFGLVVVQPEIGSALLLGLITVAMLFVGGARLRHLVGLALVSAPLLIATILGEAYRRRRLLAFLDPWSDPRGVGFHIIQSLVAIGSGGLFGVGLGQSRQKFFYLPERHTDFIFAILGEELGLVGALAVLALFALIAYRGWQITRGAPDRYSSLLACGVTFMIVVQAIMNIGVTTGVLPITGVPLPLISFGGSSLVFTMSGVGILLNVSQYCKAPEGTS